MRQTPHKDIADEDHQQRHGEESAQIHHCFEKISPRRRPLCLSCLFNGFSPFFGKKFSRLLMSMIKQNSTSAMLNSACFAGRWHSSSPRRRPSSGR